MAFASALTLGATSEWELCQLDLALDLDAARVEHEIRALAAQLPTGVRIVQFSPVPLERKNPFIQVTAACYHLTILGDDTPSRLQELISDASSLPPTLGCAVVDFEAPTLQVTLPVGERNGVRIRDFVAAVEAVLPGIRVTRIHRNRLICDREPEVESAIAVR
jgi:hypothetical protein